MDAAIVTIAERGADHLSLRDVARRIGVSHAAPAHHFGDKAGLLTAIATEGFTLFTDHLAVVADDGEDPARELAELGRAYAEFAERYPAHFDVMFRPALIRTSDPALGPASAAAFAALRGRIVRFQARGWRAREDTAALTVAAWALAHGIAVLRAQGSVARHYDDASLDGVVAIADSLLGPD